MNATINLTAHKITPPSEWLGERTTGGGGTVRDIMPFDGMVAFVWVSDTKGLVGYTCAFDAETATPNALLDGVPVHVDLGLLSPNVYAAFGEPPEDLRWDELANEFVENA